MSNVKFRESVCHQCVVALVRWCRVTSWIVELLPWKCYKLPALGDPVQRDSNGALVQDILSLRHLHHLHDAQHDEDPFPWLFPVCPRPRTAIFLLQLRRVSSQCSEFLCIKCKWDINAQIKVLIHHNETSRKAVDNICVHLEHVLFRDNGKIDDGK